MKKLYFLSVLYVLTSCGSDDPKPDNLNVASGKLTFYVNPTTFLGSGVATLYPASATSAYPNSDLLQVLAQQVFASGDSHYITLYYLKPKGAPDTQFKLTSALYEGDNIATVVFEDEPTGTVSKSIMGWSGTFSAKRFASRLGPTVLLEKGEFKELPY